MQSNEYYHFVTGRLAEASVRQVASELASKHGFQHSIQVMPITVAALMTARWMLRHLAVPPKATCLFLPGYLAKELEDIRKSVAEFSPSLRVECGPKNILDLPNFFGSGGEARDGYGDYSIQIIAEINHADRIPLKSLLDEARQLIRDGADVIDLGCTPGRTWQDVGQAVRELRECGFRVSIDSFNVHEVESACRSGAELVLSVNSENCQQAIDWGCEVVAIPDTPNDLASLFHTAERLRKHEVPFRMDPILQPVCLGLAESLERYAICRREFPHAEIMMGIGNLTELTDVDSAGINTLLLGVCQELRVQSVLTTQVINWARSSVRECDLARRLVHYAVQHGIPPKHLEADLVVLRDPALRGLTEEAIADIGSAITDHNFRLFTAGGKIHAVTSGLHVSGGDPFEVMQAILDRPEGKRIDVTHAFYLGFEMCKALQAITLSKNYEQDESLRWGYLTRQEQHNRLRLKADQG